VLISWQYFYETPRLEQERKHHSVPTKDVAKPNQNIESEQILERKDSIEQTNIRLPFDNKKIHGSINLTGARIDDLILADYKETLDPNSKAVEFLSPSSTDKRYFIEFGWVAEDRSIKLPNATTVWHADRANLTPEHSVNLQWDNNEGLIFIINLALDEHAMFHVTQKVINNSNTQVELSSYGLINKTLPQNYKSFSILHEGPIGVVNGVLQETPYNDLKSDGKKHFAEHKSGDWVGITDKYWLSAIIPHGQHAFASNFIYSKKTHQDRYQVDYVSPPITIAPDDKAQFCSNVFTGPKKLKLLDYYTMTKNITLFDRAIDFGWFYFLTKPLFKALLFFDSFLGNFGLAILLLTVFIKLVMYPLATKSYHSMNKMKNLQPAIAKIRDRCGDDKMRFNKEIMELYKKEGVNPLSGCLPLLIQIPVFFSLYKVLFVTIEMRHAPFYGWINDLSAPDPTSIFNLFGLIPWTPPAYLAIGIWPIIMGITMILQQKMNPEPSDPVQAKMMKFLPLIFVFMFSSFPAGLIIYWAWNNILSILQQWAINLSTKDSKRY
jgi:YidC/Oxa1 family membrane protein insertase